MKTVILCGGQGTRLQEATGGLKPKPMVEVGGRPILWHIMKSYSDSGFKEFVLCLGHLGRVIKEYFLHYEAMNSDFTVDFGETEKTIYHRRHAESDWAVTLADTGQDVMTGARVARIRRYLGDDTFMLTYGDGVADVNLNELVAFHKRQGTLVTVTGVKPGGRFGRLNIEKDMVASFEEKPGGEDGWINGGFFVCEPGIFDYLSEQPDCILERKPLERLSEDKQLSVFRHDGFWQCMDTFRDLQLLEELWVRNRAPWKTWE